MPGWGFVTWMATEGQGVPIPVCCWWCPACPPVPHPRPQGTEEDQGEELLPFLRCLYHREHQKAQWAVLGGLRVEEKGQRDTRTEKGVVVLPSRAVAAGITHCNAQRGDVFLLCISG